VKTGLADIAKLAKDISQKDNTKLYRYCKFYFQFAEALPARNYVYLIHTLTTECLQLIFPTCPSSLFFKPTTFQKLAAFPSSSEEDRLCWDPLQR
jgi:hypothetical protein